jgi:nicotinamide-nucleotide amidase
VKAELLAVGSELLTPLRSDTNAAWLTDRLLEAGVATIARITVADEPALLESAFRTALGRADLVVATGGLGPTADDLTREAAASALGRGLRRDASIVAALRERFASFGRVMSPVNEKQGDLIDGAEVVPNPRGTAPGQWLEVEGKVLVLLPGPPKEMAPMFERHVLPRVRERAGGAVLRTRVLRIAAMPESEVEQAVGPVYTAFENPRTTILGAPGQVELHLTARAATPAEAEQRIEALASRLREALPGRIYSEDGRDLAEVVAALLAARRLRLALAESCTGGLLAARLSGVPGASEFLERGFVTYSNRSKSELLGIAPELLATRGAVSEEVARAMAEGARRAAGVDVGVGITGIAGPAGGSAGKPVGLVYVALAGAAGDALLLRQFPGDRERVRLQAVQVALEMLRRGLIGLDEASA